MTELQWITDIFDAEQARRGGVVRRSVRDVEQHASMEILMKGVKSRGFHLIETGDQAVVLCNTGSFRIWC